MKYIQMNLSEIRKRLKIESKTEDLRLSIFIDEDVKISYPSEINKLKGEK